MTTPTITLYPDTLPAKGQANAPFDVNVDDFLTWLTATNGPELAAMVTWTQGVADSVLATALAGDMPPLTGEAGNYLRANAAEDGGEFRTPAEVLADIGAPSAASPSFTGDLSVDGNVIIPETIGSAGQVLTVNGGATAVEYSTPTVTVISETVVSTAVASVDLTGFVPADYTSYEVELINVVPATDAATLNARTSSDGGSSYDSGASDYGWSYSGLNTSDNTQSEGAISSEARVCQSAGSSAGEDGVSGTIRIHGPDLAKETKASYHMTYCDTAGRHAYVIGGFTRLSSADVDGVQIFFSSGNIESGTIVFRGIK